MRTGKRGFTLIELLVVVLIIGILASIALPQYQRAVEKSRTMEAITRISSLEKAMDLYVLTNGYENVSFFGMSAVEADIDVTSGLQQTIGASDLMHSEYFEYQGYCSTTGGMNVSGSTCYWSSNRFPGGEYVLWGERGAGGRWTHYCEFNEDISWAGAICNQLFKQGWQQGDIYF